MKSLLLLVINVHLILGINFILYVWILGFEKFGFKKFFKMLVSKKWLKIQLILLVMPYQILLISLAQSFKTFREMDEIFEHEENKKKLIYKCERCKSKDIQDLFNGYYHCRECKFIGVSRYE